MLEPFVGGLLDRLKTQPKEIQIALTIEDFLELSSKGSNTLILDSALLIKVNFSKKKGVNFALFKKRDNPHHPALYKILALHMVFVSI